MEIKIVVVNTRPKAITKLINLTSISPRLLTQTLNKMPEEERQRFEDLVDELCKIEREWRNR